MTTIHYAIHIDGNPIRVIENDAALAKRTALDLSEGHKAIAIIVAYGGLAASEGMYWDYKTSTWVFTHPAVAVQDAKPTRPR